MDTPALGDRCRLVVKLVFVLSCFLFLMGGSFAMASKRLTRKEGLCVFEGGTGSVSYTHLDVYKRQALD